MKIFIAALAIVCSLSANAQLAPKIKCVATLKGPQVDVTQKLTYNDGGAAINEHFLAQVGDYLFVGFYEGMMTSNLGLPFLLSIYNTELHASLVEKHVTLYSNTLDYTATATVDDVTATLTCVRFQ
jgi:hypothetical protein